MGGNYYIKIQSTDPYAVAVWKNVWDRYTLANVQLILSSIRWNTQVNISLKKANACYKLLYAALYILVITFDNDDDSPISEIQYSVYFSYTFM